MPTVEQVLAWEGDMVVSSGINMLTVAEQLTAMHGEMQGQKPNITAGLGAAGLLASGQVDDNAQAINTLADSLRQVGAAFKTAGSAIGEAQSVLRSVKRSLAALDVGARLNSDATVYLPIKPGSDTPAQVGMTTLYDADAEQRDRAAGLESKALTAFADAVQADKDMMRAMSIAFMGIDPVKQQRLRMVSLAVNFVPVVGTVKGIIEAADGKDMISGDELSTGERILSGVASFIPVAGAGVRGVAKGTISTTRAVSAVDRLRVGTASVLESQIARVTATDLATGRTTVASSIRADASMTTPDFEAMRAAGGFGGGARIGNANGLDFTRETGEISASMANMSRADDPRMIINAVGEGDTVLVNGKFLNAKQFAMVLRDGGQLDGNAIVLTANGTGRFSDGFAKQLADELGVPVSAPDKFARVDADGNVVSSGALTGPASADGDLQTFLPSVGAPVSRSASELAPELAAKIDGIEPLAPGAPWLSDKYYVFPNTTKPEDFAVWRNASHHFEDWYRAEHGITAREVPSDRAKEGFVRDQETLSLPRALTEGEQAMAAKQPVLVERLGGGLNDTFKVTFSDNTSAVFKPMDGGVQSRSTIPARDLYRYEVAAYRIDEALGFGRVPPTAAVDDQLLGRGSMQAWVEGSGVSRTYAPEQPWLSTDFAGFYSDAAQLPLRQRQQIAVLDYVMANSDRHTGNLAFDEARNAVAIDNGSSFVGVFNGVRSPFVQEFYNKDLSFDVLNAARGVDQDALRSSLREAGVPADRVDDAMGRLNEIAVNGRITGEAWEEAGGGYHPNFVPADKQYTHMEMPNYLDDKGDEVII